MILVERPSAQRVGVGDGRTRARALVHLRVSVASDVEGDEVFPGNPLQRGAYDLVYVAGGAFPDAPFFHVGVEAVKILDGYLPERYFAYID